MKRTTVHASEIRPSQPLGRRIIDKVSNECSPTERVVGLAESAITRVVNLGDRVGAMKGHAESQLDRLLSTTPERDGDKAGAAPFADGQMHVLHFQLTQLENAVDALHSQLRRIEEL